MTEISPQALAEADKLLDYDLAHHRRNAVALRLQQVSDAAKKADATAELNGFEPLSVLRQHFAPFILPDPPVDPLIAEAEALVRDHWKGEAGNFALAALKRGMELAK
jgi:hypothetical protein